MHERLKSFLAAVDAGGYQEAARQRGITQSALSKQIQALEQQLGSRLLDRGRNGTRPTAIGQALLPRARAILTAGADLLKDAEALRRGTAGILRVGFGMSSIALAPHAIARFRSSHPGVEVRLTDMSSAAQVDAVRTGELDAGFVRLPVTEDLAQQPVGADHLALASIGSPGPAESGEDSRALLARQPLIRLSAARGPGLSAQIDEWSRANGVPLSTAVEAADLQTVLAIVASGAGPAIVPATARRIAPPEVTITPLTGPASDWQVGLIWDPDRLTPPASAFVRACRRSRVRTAAPSPGR